MSWKDLFRRKKAPQQLATATEAQPPVKADSEPIEEELKPGSDERILAAKQWHREGKIAEAEAVYLDILKNDPEHAQARHMAGVICLQRRQAPEAEKYFRQAISLDNTQASFHSNLGNALSAQNRIEEAYNSFKKAVELNPQNVATLSNAATALLSMRRASEAKPLYLQMLAIEPDSINARRGLAAAHIEERDIHSAIAVLREGLEIQPHDFGLLIQLASALELVNQLDEASAIISQIESVQPGVARVSMLAGLIARRRGEFDVAEKRLKAALAQGLPADEKIEALSQLGLALDAMGKAGEAFVSFESSNKGLARFVGEQKANGTAFLQEVTAIKHYFTQEKFAALANTFATDDNFQPVFFVGFPRSGTTLMEQVMKAHPGLVTTEERSPLYAVIREINSSGQYPQGLEHLAEEDLARLRQYFREFCRANIGDLDGKQVVDKLPLNIVNMALAKLLFPQAKIIVALRDPRDACLSCFMQKFDLNDAMANFLDLKTTGLAYEAVMDLWLHYRTILDGSWLEYRYESLVENFDDTVSQVLDFIGVGWHDEIRNYRQEAKQRAISTPSYQDVTAKIDSHAIARWRKYEQNLEPILPSLQPYVEAFDYE